MPPLMNRLAELLGPDLAQRLADEFAGQTIYFRMKDVHALRDQIRRNGDAIKQWTRDELRETGRVVDRGDGFLELQRTPEESAAVDAAILAEFDGSNHCQLARHYRVSVQWVHRLVQQAQREALASALQASGESSPAEVLWASPLLQLGRPNALAAALRAIETATAQGRLDQLVVALAFLPPEPATAHHATGRPAPSAPAESQPGTPAHADSSPSR